MDVNKVIIDKLRPYDIKENKVVFDRFEIEDYTLKKIEELIISVAQILDFDEEKSVLTVAVKAGSFNMHEAVLALIKEDGVIHLGAYASEGLISQHTSEKAIKRIKELLEKK